MRVAEHNDVCTPFFQRLSSATARVLMLDYDGTLAPFTPDRSRAFPYREVPELVSRIMKCGTRVVLISGRPATELLFLSGIHPHPEIWGSHGAERLRPDGAYEVETPGPKQREGLQAVNRILRGIGLTNRIETKPGGIAIHWRGLADQEREVIEEKVRSACTPLVGRYGMHLLPFDGGIEIRATNRNKGDAVGTILADMGEDTAAAYLGDDQTDEDGFRAIKGHGLSVLIRTEPRPTAADVWLRPPEELGRFLRQWAAACGVDA
jgi:trehalose 6-phosphate phosphatase